MNREYIYASDNDVIVTSAKDIASAQRQVEKELGRKVEQSEITVL